jgi:hypothetical protein
MVVQTGVTCVAMQGPRIQEPVADGPVLCQMTIQQVGHKCSWGSSLRAEMVGHAPGWTRILPGFSGKTILRM